MTREILSGILSLNKPAGKTSREIVNQVQRLERRLKVGHAGTLDPMATGVLLICVGAATRLVPWLHEHPKTYVAKFLLGRTSNTDDITGDVEIREQSPSVSREDVETALRAFVGEIEQIPPQFSAVRVEGVRAYKNARRGKEIDLAPRSVTVHRIELRNWSSPELELEIECGSGTYVRSIGRDLGAALGCGGVMSDLVRTRIGPFELSQARDLEQIGRNNLATALVPMVDSLPAMPRRSCTESDIRAIIQGKKIPRQIGNSTGVVDQEVALIDGAGNLLGIAVVDGSGEMLQPSAVFCASRLSEREDARSQG